MAACLPLFERKDLHSPQLDSTEPYLILFDSLTPSEITEQGNHAFKMPLVVPGLMGTGGDDKLSKWQNELMGKKLGDQSDQMVDHCPRLQSLFQDAG